MKRPNIGHMRGHISGIHLSSSAERSASNARRNCRGSREAHHSESTLASVAPTKSTSFFSFRSTGTEHVAAFSTCSFDDSPSSPTLDFSCDVRAFESRPLRDLTDER